MGDDPQAHAVPGAAEPPHHAISAAGSLARLGSDLAGLSSSAVAERLARFGRNLLPEPKGKTILGIFLAQFASPFVYLLLAAAVVAVVMDDVADAGFIGVVLLLNAGIGAFQEARADRRANALKSLVPRWVTVRRDGHPQRLDARDLVPGDVVQVESGLRIPADLRLVDAQDLRADESMLTGESLPVAKDAAAAVPAAAMLGDRVTMLHAGTTVVAGRGTGLVAATGASTEVGRIAAALAKDDAPVPPLVRRMARFTNGLAVAVLSLIVILASVELLRGSPFETVLLVAVALAVAAIPEGLPVAITVALSISVHRLSLRDVVVRVLPAVEGLGACTLIASDKTGTLTLNELTVERLWLPGAGEAEATDPACRALAQAGTLCNEAALALDGGRAGAVGDTVDIAFLAFARAQGIDVSEEARRTLVCIPYEPERKFAAAFSASGSGAGEGIVASVKGAAETVLGMCAGVGEAEAAAARALAAGGYRVIAVASGRVAKAEEGALSGLTLLGFAGLIDPLRPGARDAVQRAQAAGIAVRMITGDHPLTALAIARQLGLAQDEDDVVAGAELQELDSAGFARVVAAAKVFARIEPLQKLRIVEALRAQGHVVAVTGDGINDAPALNAADIGVAMGKGGTDVAREAADLILVKDDFPAIVAGIEEGRVAYDNVRKVILFTVSTGAAEILLFTLAVAAGLPPPLTAVQLLWLNLVTNGVQDVALAFERGERDVLARKPRPPGESILDRRMIEQLLLSGAVIGGTSFAAYWWMLDAGWSHATAQNAILWLIVCFENVHCFNCRSERVSVWKVPFSANPYLVLGVLGTQALQAGAAWTPGLADILGVAHPSLGQWALLLALALVIVPVMEAYKRLRRA
ncbi:MAG: HAD-IC family P-type ATPase [Alphaproteobacteria bacterium]|nr:HAD-IC family P-type ATPase [Alphaproteobacteria bacterium]